MAVMQNGEVRECRVQFDLVEGGLPRTQRLRSGHSLRYADERFCRAFGGCHRQEVLGCWIDPKTGQFTYDTSVEYTVAIPTASWQQFMNECRAIGSGQQSLYMVKYDGLPMIVDLLTGPYSMFKTEEHALGPKVGITHKRIGGIGGPWG